MGLLHILHNILIILMIIYIRYAQLIANNLEYFQLLNFYNDVHGIFKIFFST